MGGTITLNETLVQNAALLAVGSTCVLTGVGVAAFGIFAAPAAGLAGWGAKSFFDNWSAKSPKKKRALKKVQAQINKTLRGSALFADIDPALLETINKDLPTALSQGWPAPKVIAQLAKNDGGFPAAIADHVIAEFRNKAFVNGALKTAEAEPYIRAVIEAALDAALADEKYFKTLEPHVLMETLGLTGGIKRAVEALSDLPNDVRSVGDAVEIVNDKLNAMRETQLENRADIQEMLTILRGGQTPSPDADANIQKTVIEMLSSDREATKLAVADLMADPSDPATATSRLKQAIAERADARREATDGAIDMLKEVAAINYYINGGEAVAAYEEIVKLTPNDAESWNILGELNRRLGDLEGAVVAYQQVEIIGSILKEEKLQAVAMGNLGIIEQIRGNLTAAERYQKESLKLYYRLQNKQGIANVNTNLGIIACIRGELKSATTYYLSSLEFNKELKNEKAMASDFGNLGVVEQLRDNLYEAIKYFEKSLKLHQQLGVKEAIASDYGNLGTIFYKKGDLEKALKYYQKSLAIEREIGRKEGMATDYGNIGCLKLEQEKFDEAIECHEKALFLYEQLGSKSGIAIEYANLGRLEKSRGNTQSTRMYWKKALVLFTEIGAAPRIQLIKGWLDDLDNVP